MDSSKIHSCDNWIGKLLTVSHCNRVRFQILQALLDSFRQIFQALPVCFDHPHEGIPVSFMNPYVEIKIATPANIAVSSTGVDILCAQHVHHFP